MQNEKQENNKHKMNIKIILFYLTYIFIFPIFKYKKHREFIVGKIKTLKILQQRMADVAVNSQNEIKTLIKNHNDNICKNGKICMRNIVNTEVKLTNFAFVNSEVEGLDKILLYEEENAKLLKEFKSHLSSGIQEVDSLRQSYYSIVGYIYFHYHKWPKRVLLDKSEFSIYEYIESKEN